MNENFEGTGGRRFILSIVIITELRVELAERLVN